MEELLAMRGGSPNVQLIRDGLDRPAVGGDGFLDAPDDFGVLRGHVEAFRRILVHLVEERGVCTTGPSGP
jgi:hypothetical protein